jgi:hypothetical protein
MNQNHRLDYLTAVRRPLYTAGHPRRLWPRPAQGRDRRLKAPVALHYYMQDRTWLLTVGEPSATYAPDRDEHCSSCWLGSRLPVLRHRYPGANHSSNDIALCGPVVRIPPGVSKRPASEHRVGLAGRSFPMPLTMLKIEPARLAPVFAHRLTSVHKHLF